VGHSVLVNFSCLELGINLQSSQDKSLCDLCNFKSGQETGP
jgi:hypothetical protein